MADFTCIVATGSSIVRYLNLCFEERSPIQNQKTRACLVRTEDLNRDINDLIKFPALSLFLYRVNFNETMRAAWAAMGHRDGEAHLPLDLHFLLTPWAENADSEYRILGRAMQCLNNLPILSGPSLDPLTNWAPYEGIQLYLEDLSTEDVMRTFDSLPVDYKLSVPYVARLVVLDGHERNNDVPVTTAVAGLRNGVASE
ncbi:DUF4255 domain-containing protein [Desulfogranum marinum]|uniref:DUF4255 domain-containing protein n=1 Tax=Desulfogranum marinum TaxID=453220 RepID=UPI0029C8C9DC|nr:DUF4255 domain-containing protein [Desulfogranum marinum]